MADIILTGTSGLDGKPGNKGATGVNDKEQGTGQPGDNTSKDKPGWFSKCKQATDGTKGATGGNGTAGDSGHPGLDAPTLIINVTDGFVPNSKAVDIESTGGNGGKGGDGGTGGTGAVGGLAGVNNEKCLNKNDTFAASGGEGGDGGRGGNGGVGGNAGNGGTVNITSQVAGIEQFFTVNSLPGQPGRGGASGPGGAPGQGGENEVYPEGSTPTFASRGATGGSGNPANNGKPGKKGSVNFF